MDNNKYRNKYRIPSTRLQKWDYGWNAIYFVTICTWHREHYFGEINNGAMCLSPIGTIANVLWHELKNHFNHIELDAFVVMPNHIHGIIAINNNVNNGDNIATTHDMVATHAVETTHALSLQSQPQSAKTIGQRRFQHQGSDTLSSIVGSYKSAVSRHAHRLGYDFAWQLRFYDRIIRNNDALTRVQTYIVNNPLNWKEDKFYNQ
ncbi:MAG: transposase [Paludibacteraceae bacterium]